jgi:hypothetical protein
MEESACATGRANDIREVRIGFGASEVVGSYRGQLSALGKCGRCEEHPGNEQGNLLHEASWFATHLSDIDSTEHQGKQHAPLPRLCSSVLLTSMMYNSLAVVKAQLSRRSQSCSRWWRVCRAAQRRLIHRSALRTGEQSRRSTEALPVVTSA